MAMKFETVKHEEAAAQMQRVLGKIVASAEKNELRGVLAMLLKGAKEGSAKANDILRIASMLDVEVPAELRLIQEALLKADAELEAKQRSSAADSREAGAKKRRLQKEQEERDAADRAAFERWKRSYSAMSNGLDAPGDPAAN